MQKPIHREVTLEQERQGTAGLGERVQTRWIIRAGEAGLRVDVKCEQDPDSTATDSGQGARHGMNQDVEVSKASYDNKLATNKTKVIT